MANVMEQALLLPSDMADLRSIRKHEVFFGLKKDLTMVSPSPNTLSFFSFFYFKKKKIFSKLFPFLSFFFLIMFLSLTGCSSHI